MTQCFLNGDEKEIRREACFRQTNRKGRRRSVAGAVTRELGLERYEGAGGGRRGDKAWWATVGTQNVSRTAREVPGE